MRALLLAAILVAACSQPSPAVVTPSPTREPGVLEVTVLLDLSGNRAPKGDAQRDAVQLWTDLQGSRGPGSTRVRAKVVDVASSDARLLIELRRAAEEDRADAVVIGTPAPALAGALDAARLPVLFTLPVAEVGAATGGHWGFRLAPAPEQIARYTLDALPVLAGAPMVVLLHEGRPLDPETAAFIAAYESGGTQPVLYRWDRTKGDLAPILRGLLTPTTRVYVSGAPREYQGVVAGARGAIGATFLLSWLTDPADLGDFRDSAIAALWPAPRALANATASTSQMRREFLRAYGDRHGTPSAHAAAAYDALALLQLAAERVGVGDRERLRAQLASLSVQGVATTYAFGADRRTGFAYEDLGLFQWNGSTPTLATPSPTPRTAE